MLADQRIAVVMPAYDEAGFVASAIASVPTFVDDIVVIDDASHDETSAAANTAARPGLRVIRHAENRGVGAAIVTGYREATKLGADIVVVMAGDGQMHPADLEGLLAPILEGKADYTKGDRLHHPDVAAVMPVERYVGSRVLSWLTKRAVGLDALSDSQCGYTAIRRTALERIDLDALWPRFGYPNDLLGALVRAEQRVVDVPVRPVYGQEQSHLRAWHVPTIGYLIGRAFVRRIAGW